MITEQDLQAAIAECQGVRNPNSSTCIKLAAFLTIQKELFGEKKQPETAEDPDVSYSYSNKNLPETAVDYQGDSEFSLAINGREQSEIWPIMDELMTVLEATNQRLYAGVMRKIKA